MNETAGWLSGTSLRDGAHGKRRARFAMLRTGVGLLSAIAFSDSGMPDFSFLTTSSSSDILAWEADPYASASLLEDSSSASSEE